MSRRKNLTMHLMGWTLVAGVVMSALIVYALLALAGSMEHGTLRIDGEPVTLDALGAEHWLMAVAAVAVTLFTVLLIVPFTVVVTLALAGIALLAATLAFTGALAVVLSPLIVVALAAWLLWRLLRRKRTPGATIPP